MKRGERWLSSAIFFSFLQKVLGAGVIRTNHTDPCWELSIFRRPLLLFLCRETALGRASFTATSRGREIMNILLVGGSSGLMNRMIQKFKKEGHRVCLLTGSRFKNDSYEKVFETYRFPYDSESVRDVFESVLPDVTVFFGAYDSNFRWNGERKMSVQFITGLTNLLMSFDTSGRGRFLYLSSEEVYGGDWPEDIAEEEEVKPETVKGMALAQGENLCDFFGKLTGRDIITLRLQHVYGIPDKRTDCNETLTWFCLESLRGNVLRADAGRRFALLYESDAVEFVYETAVCKYHDNSVYNLSSSVETNEAELARQIFSAVWTEEANGKTEPVVYTSTPETRCVLSNKRFVEEFGESIFGNTEKNIKKITDRMKASKTVFLTDLEKKPTLWEKVKRNAGWLTRAVIPFAENILLFIPVFFIKNYATGNTYFSRLDIYLLYVLLFAIVHGQHQAIFSASLATIGFFFRQTFERSGFAVAVDYNTYIWIAQLFIVGLSVGYLRDRILHLRDEMADEQEYLSGQLVDVRKINESNVRVKDALTTQIINQNDSIGKIYHMTSSLDQLSPEDVLFRAASMLGELMDSKDVAVYTVADATYARLFSSTSQKARKGGNSIQYWELGSLSEALQNHKVYINR
jgi:nucleoside-diphosphate-sugar epimerase